MLSGFIKFSFCPEPKAFMIIIFDQMTVYLTNHDFIFVHETHISQRNEAEVRCPRSTFSRGKQFVFL